MAKVRADQLLAEKGVCESREAAKRMVMAGKAWVMVNGRREPLDKPGRQLAPESEVGITTPEPFVSRGARKLVTALDHFGLEPEGRVCLDAGASTGGFTDCLLQRGAARVYAVDVGYGQLHEKLLNDPRVVNLERTNIRRAPDDLIPEPVHLAVADLSFISLTKVLSPMARWLAPGARVVALIKPQFEVGPRHVGKGGVVREESARLAAVEKIREFGLNRLGWECRGVIPSGIKGPKGNQEYLILFAAP
jgi:23S rRNA (cytidine1920-2'-O)/16S rRNA (cytidine1409-2'-O)-methyltransferase